MISLISSFLDRPKVSWDCVTKGVKQSRYKHVDVVRIPEEKLSSFRAVNRDKCASDALMPKYSSTMFLGNLTKSHFTHAQKLAKDGNRTLFNEGKVSIVYQAKQAEGSAILSEGVLCTVYKAELLDDPEALDAIMNADNENADLEMEEDEVQAQGRVDAAVQSCLHLSGSEAVTVDTVLAAMMTSGLRAFSEEQTKDLIKFRLMLSTGVFNCFRQCAFHAVGSRVRVKPSDYGIVAPLDSRAQWVKVSIVMRSVRVRTDIFDQISFLHKYQERSRDRNPPATCTLRPELVDPSLGALAGTKSPRAEIGG